MAKKPINQKTIESLVHDEAKRKNIPTAEHESVVNQNDKRPIKIKYPRNTDLDPQLVWRGKDEQDWSDLVVNAPPIYIQEKVYPKVLIDDLPSNISDWKSAGGIGVKYNSSSPESAYKKLEELGLYERDIAKKGV